MAWLILLSVLIVYMILLRLHEDLIRPWFVPLDIAVYSMWRMKSWAVRKSVCLLGCCLVISFEIHHDGVIFFSLASVEQLLQPEYTNC